MKAFALILISLAISEARASYLVTNCSNSKGTVMWESGTHNNTIDLKYANFVEGTLTLDLDQVQIQFLKQVPVSEKRISECSYKASTKVFASKVKIVAATHNPDVLRGQFPENKIETEVICTQFVANPLPCPENN